jgi:predicted nucleic acid-binding protein
MTARLRAAVVSDAGPLIGLARADALSVLPSFFSEVWIPPAVLDELRCDSTRPGAAQLSDALAAGWLLPKPAASSLPQAMRPLGPGETQAIALAIEHRLPILIDERLGRTEARRHHLIVIGTAGLLIRAKQEGKIRRVRPTLTALAESGYRLSESLTREVLRLAREAPAGRHRTR